MKRTNHSLILGAVFLSIFGTSPSALPLWPHQRAELFATCVGRLEALALDHTRVDSDAAERLRGQKQGFEMLLEATLPAALDDGVPEKMPRIWRAGGWSEIAHLLAEMQYSLDQGRADRAEAVLDERLHECEGVLLS